MKVVLIPCAATEWRNTGRLLGRVELELKDSAEQECLAWVDQLQPLGIKKLFVAPDDACRGTAKIIGRALGMSAKAVDDLVEVDLGLWAGLTEEQLKTRYARAHKQLEEQPLMVSPPGGEDFSAAAKRVEAAIRKRVKPNGKPVALVLRPVSLALARQVLAPHATDEIWETAQETNGPIVLDVEPAPAPARV